VEIDGRSSIGGQMIVQYAPENAKLQSENKRRLDFAFQLLGTRAKEYLAAIARMDNAHYSTYLKYRYLVPNRRKVMYVPSGE
jgi:hypothetical protein